MATTSTSGRDVTLAQYLHDVIGGLRNSAWVAQAVLEHVPAVAALADEDAPQASPSEAWWHAQGRAEAFAEVMTLLEAHGAAVVLVRCGSPAA